MRAWQVKRRERTRQLIELGGLVAKAGLIDLTGDDRTAIFGLLTEAAATLRGDGRAVQLLRWRRRGSRAFALDTGKPGSGPLCNTPVQPTSEEFGS